MKALVAFDEFLQHPIPPPAPFSQPKGKENKDFGEENKDALYIRYYIAKIKTL